MRRLLDSIKLADLVQCVDAGRETSVKAEHLVLDDSGEGQIIEKLCELFPDIGVAVFPQTLIIKSIPKRVSKVKLISLNVHVGAMTLIELGE